MQSIRKNRTITSKTLIIMIEDSKVIFITHPYYAVNNPSNNLRLYMKAKNSNKWRYIQCKTKIVGIIMMKGNKLWKKIK